VSREVAIVKLKKTRAVRIIKVTQKPAGKRGESVQWTMTIPSTLMKTVFRSVRAFAVHVGLMGEKPVMILEPVKSADEAELQMWGYFLEEMFREKEAAEGGKHE
jgi:hypothetical protein